MSFELKLARKCDHRLFRQLRPFEADKKTVRLRTLLGSTKDFAIRINGYDAPTDHPYSGWSLVKDETSVAVGQRKVVFKTKRKSTTDWVELSYYTNPDTCPKCLGIRLLFDIEYSNVGRVITVEDEDKLSQDLEKIFLTVVGSDLYHPWYGTSLVTMIGSKEPRGFVRLQIQRELSNAAANLKDLQGQQESFQVVSDREFLFQVDAILVQGTSDPTVYTADVRVRTQAGGVVAFSRSLRFDHPFFSDTREEIRRRQA